MHTQLPLLDRGICTNHRCPHASCSPLNVKRFGCGVARYRASERVVFRPGLRGNMWTASAGARGLLRKQLEAYESPGIIASRLRVGCNCLETVALNSHPRCFKDRILRRR